tara:strand:- start:211 stop:492 length:282 start_codon:yes stop_codon:yes gene_type:complete
MNVKEAVQRARTIFSDLFADDLINDIGLEEVTFDDQAKIWRITIGFYRDSDMGKLGIALGGPKNADVKRYYRTLEIDDLSGELVSVKIRQVAA